MSDSGKAIFLSYASHDADAALLDTAVGAAFARAVVRPEAQIAAPAAASTQTNSTSLAALIQREPTA